MSYGFTQAESRALGRRKEQFFDERQQWYVKYAVMILVLSAMIFFITEVFHFPVATAADQPSGILTKAQVCEWSKVSGEKVVNGINPCV